MSVERADAFEVTVDDGMELREGQWDGARSRRDLFAWADDDLQKASRGFTVADLDPPGDEPTRADLKLPVAYVENGELVGIGAGIRNALARLPQTDESELDGLSDTVREEARRTLRSMLNRLNEQTAADLAAEFGWPLAQAAALVADAELLLEEIGEDEPLRSLLDVARALVVTRDDGSSKAVWRWSRVDLELGESQRAVIDRAITVAERHRHDGDGAATLKTIADELRTDGLEQHLTPDGFLKLKVFAARTGSQRYTDGVTSWWEFRSDDEVGAAPSLESYGLKPMADDHPPVFITAANYREFAVGSCGQDAVLLEDLVEGPDGHRHRYVQLTVLIGDLETLRKIRRGKLELSAGYTTVTVADDGVDSNGQRYQYRQTQIRINHLALVDRGRAGPLARISLDGSAWEPSTTEDEHKDKDNKDMPTPKKDQLDPEAGAMLLSAIAAYLMPESPEAGAAALETISTMTGVDPGAVRAALALGEATEEVELADGINALMTASAKAAWDARLEQAEQSADSVTKTVAEMRGQIDALQATVTGFKDEAKAAARDALRREIGDMCPALGKAWDKRIAEGTFDLSETAMREAAILTLAPELKPVIDAERKTPETFDAALRGQFSGLANKRSTPPDDPRSDGDNHSTIGMNELKLAIAKGTYGM
jgi:hypothetical protein